MSDATSGRLSAVFAAFLGAHHDAWRRAAEERSGDAGALGADEADGGDDSDDDAARVCALLAPRQGGQPQSCGRSAPLTVRLHEVEGPVSGGDPE